MRLGRILGLVIPLSTLLGLGVTYSLRKLIGEAPKTLELPPSAPTNLPELASLQRPRVLEGVVLDSKSRPLSDALVFVRAEDVPAWTYTDKEVRFRLERVPEGELSARIVAFGHAPGSSRIEADAADIVLRVERAYEAAPSLDTRPPGALSGQLSIDGRAPLSGTEALGLEVLLLPLDAERICERLDGPMPARARADENGRFAFETVFPGSYSVRVVPAWAQSAGSPDLLQSLAGREPAREFEYRPDMPPLLLDLALGVWELELRDERGAPVEGAAGFLRAQSASRDAWPPQVSDALGRLRFTHLPPGEYALEVQSGAWRASRTAQLAADQLLREALSTARREEQAR
jgi:protocatechuate 3,4-dioxygenase beta subunit